MHTVPLNHLYTAMSQVNYKERGMRTIVAGLIGTSCTSEFHAAYNFLSDYMDGVRDRWVEELAGFTHAEKLVDSFFTVLTPDQVFNLNAESKVVESTAKTNPLYKLMLHKLYGEVESGYAQELILKANLEDTFILIASNVVDMWKRITAPKTQIKNH